MKNKSLSTFSSRVIPQYIRDEYPNFEGFIQHYFQFLERKVSGKEFVIDYIISGDEDLNNIWSGEYIVIVGATSDTYDKLVGTTINGHTSGASSKVLSVYTHKNYNNLGKDVLSIKVLPFEFVYPASGNIFQVGETFTYTDLGVYTQVAEMMLYRDIDHTIDEFIDEHIYEYVADFPVSMTGSLKFLIKTVRDYYTSRGSEKSFEYLFRALYGSDVFFYYPKVDILRTSDGRWTIPYYIYFENTFEEITTELNHQYIIGNTSGATGYVEELIQLEHPLLSGLNEQFVSVSNVDGDFLPNETVSRVDDPSHFLIVSSQADAIRSGNGYWNGKQGLLSGTNKLQDNFFYQEYSYVLRSRVPIDIWEKPIKKLIHPAGLELFGDLMLSDDESNVIGFNRIFGEFELDITDPIQLSTIMSPIIKEFYELTLELPTEDVALILNEFLLSLDFELHPDINLTLKNANATPYVDRVIIAVEHFISNTLDFELNIDALLNKSPISDINVSDKYLINRNTWSYLESTREVNIDINQLQLNMLFKTPTIKIGDFYNKANVLFPYTETDITFIAN